MIKIWMEIIREKTLSKKQKIKIIIKINRKIKRMSKMGRNKTKKMSQKAIFLKNS